MSKIYLNIFCREIKKKKKSKLDLIYSIPLKPPYAKHSTRPNSKITPTSTVSTAMCYINLKITRSS